MPRRESDVEQALVRLERVAARANQLRDRGCAPRETWDELAADSTLLARQLRGIIEEGPQTPRVADALAAYDDGPVLHCSVEVGSWRILWCNRRLAETLGGSPAELVGRDLCEFVFPADRSVAGDALGALARGAEPRRCEFRLVGDRGQALRVLLSGSLSAAASDPPRLRLRLEDVSHERLLERELRRSQRQVTVGRLARGIAHDLNNLITVIRATVALASDAAQGAGIAGELEAIDRAAGRAAELTQQLLVFSRARRGTPQEVDLDESLQRSGRLLRRGLGEGLRLVEERASGLWPVWIDPGQLEQLVTQLVLCMPAASGVGESLTISANNCDLSEEGARTLGLPAGPYVRIRIEQRAPDSRDGEGASAAEARTERRGWGSPPVELSLEEGVLASCESIAQQAGGALRLRCDEPGLACCEVYLPRATPTSEGEPATAPSEVPGHGERILLVEDDGLVRGVVRRILESAGYAVNEAADARTAMASAEGAAPYDLLITDIVMPDLDGPQLAEELTQRGLTQRVLYVTGHAGELVARHGLDEATLDLLAKPFVPERLLARVRQLLDQHPKS